MKRTGIIGLIVLIIGLIACEKEKTASPASDEATARTATLAGGKFKAVTVDQLPAIIKTYVQDQYAGATIKEAGQGPRGNYGVLIDQSGTEKGLLFKADGTFKGAHNVKRKNLGESALPTLAKVYLKKNYAASTVKRVSQGPRGNYSVVLQTGDEYQLVAFTKNGVFLKSFDKSAGGKLLETSEIPSTITTYIQSNYAGAEIKHSGQGPRGKYGIVLEVSGKRKVLIFDQSGSFLTELSR